jgi:hypothetical protein
MEVKSFFLQYLLMPLIALITVPLLLFLNKKAKLMKNKQLIIGILILSLLMAIPGFLGFLSFGFMPWGYLLCESYYLGLGAIFVYLLLLKYPEELEEKKFFIIFGILISSLLGFYLFYLAFHWLSSIRMEMYAGTSVLTFIIPLLFWWAYTALISIPTEIYKIWQYPSIPMNIDMDHLDFDRMLVLDLELFKSADDAEPMRVKVKAPENMVFGNWFYKFIEDYNVKFPKNPVQFSSDNADSYKWIFFIKTSFFKRNLFIDPDQDILQNHISEKIIIHAKRVSENAPALGNIKEENVVFE